MTRRNKNKKKKKTAKQLSWPIIIILFFFVIKQFKTDLSKNAVVDWRQLFAAWATLQAAISSAKLERRNIDRLIVPCARCGGSAGS